MTIIEGLVNDYIFYIVAGLVVVLIVSLVINIINAVTISKLSKRYRKFMRGNKDKNMEELLMDFVSKLDAMEGKVDKNDKLYKDMDSRMKKCVQKVSIIRYKAFDEMGAALSFSIAMLDANNDGIIVTGIYGRNECTTYAKPVDKGIPKYDLSDEEETVLQDAIKKR
ncbi:hypothetical protein OXPF_37130 [Oxobacter pfennigii]|uniref:DUF4446 domain-containing protein n=1 Tax=Oxobacter pfennigii TaxID=36849 RepID=A0A0N8NST7_9CLOT|nr:DUF4446 family protein [Oxobacter pfennigii]KPU42944.1 hypothetical protein OXPF_37130 [Oxobacter pfennigii]